MVSGRKKPPIRLDELEDAESTSGTDSEARRPGELSYTSEKTASAGSDIRSKDRMSWRPVLLGVMVSVIFTGILVFGFSASKTDVKALVANDKDLSASTSARLASIDASLAKALKEVDTAITESRSAKSVLDGYVKKTDAATIVNLSNYVTRSELSTYALKTDIPAPANVSALTLKVGTLEATVADLQAKVKDLTAVTEQANAYVGATTRWTSTVSFVGGDPTGITLWLDHDRIEEDDFYELTLGLENTTADPITISPIFEIILTPRDYVVIDEKATYMDSDSSPFVDWNVDVLSRTRNGIEVVRRLVFTSDRYSSFIIPAGNVVEFDLVMELAYK